MGLKEKIGEYLVKINSMTNDQISDVLKRQDGGDKRIFGEIACELGFADKESINEYYYLSQDFTAEKINNKKQKKSFFKNIFNYITPIQLLVLGYLLVTLAGAVLLSLPISTQKHISQPFIDSMFVATSGISTSGLTVVDIGSYYTLFGQLVLMCIFQIGGIGYMTFLMFFIYLFGIRLPSLTKNAALESISGNNYKLFGRFFLYVLAFTVIFEVLGAMILTLSLTNDYMIKKAIYFGIFHSISTFCTAGFSTISDSLMKYVYNPVINYTVIILSIIGGIGFIVLYDIYMSIIKKIKKITSNKITLHSKIVILVTLIVIALGTIVIFFAEKWTDSISIIDRFMISLFQSVSASTTDGFNTMDIGRMNPSSLLMLIVLMFIGASPGSTGGGIKTSTIGIIFIFIMSQIKGKESNINFLKREIPDGTISKSFGIFFWFIIIIIADLLVLNITEKASFLQIFFETVSALGNTGLSMGITSGLSFTGKIMLIITMFIGRVGPLTFVFSLAGKSKTLPYRYAQENIFVG